MPAAAAAPFPSPGPATSSAPRSSEGPWGRQGSQYPPRAGATTQGPMESSRSHSKSPVYSGNEQVPRQSHGDTGCSAQPHLLLLQTDHGAIAATAPLPLEGCNLFRLDFQDLLLLFMLQLQFLGGGSPVRRGRSAVGRRPAGKAMSCTHSLKFL